MIMTAVCVCACVHVNERELEKVRAKERDLGHTGTYNCKINMPSLLKHQQIIKYFALHNLLRCSLPYAFSMQINTLII